MKQVDVEKEMKSPVQEIEDKQQELEERCNKKEALREKRKEAMQDVQRHSKQKLETAEQVAEPG